MGIIGNPFRGLMDYLTKYDSDELDRIISAECEPWYTACGSGIKLTSTRGKFIFFAFFTSMMVVYCFHSVFGVVTAALAYTCNLEYACIIGYTTFNGFWATTIFYTQFSRRPNFAFAFIIIGKNFFNYDSEPGITSPMRLRIRIMQVITQKYLKYIPLVIFVCDSFYMFFMPKLVCNNPHLDDALLFPAYHPVPTDDQVSVFMKNFFEMFFLFAVIIIACAGMFFFVNGAFHIIIQTLRLIDSINDIEERARRLFLKKFGHQSKDNTMRTLDLSQNRGFIDCYQFCLKENIRHHQILIEFHYHFQQSCQLPLGVILFLSSFIVALLLLLMFDDSFFGSFLVGFCLLTITFMGLAVVSTIGQYFLDLAEGIRDAVYNIHWPGSDKKITSLVSVVLEVTKKPIRPCVLGFLHYDRPGFLLIINAAYSYWNFLRLLQSIRAKEN